MSLARLSTILFSGGARLDQIAAGSDIGVRRLEKANLALRSLEKQHGIHPSSSPEAGADGAGDAADAAAVPPGADVAKPEAAGGTDFSEMEVMR